MRLEMCVTPQEHDAFVEAARQAGYEATAEWLRAIASHEARLLTWRLGLDPEPDSDEPTESWEPVVTDVRDARVPSTWPPKPEKP